MKYNKTTNVAVSEHFNTSEFHCEGNGCCNITLISEELIEKLEILRELVHSFTKKEQLLIINSGYRCNNHNKKVGGALFSQHVRGNAADVRLPDGLTVDQFAALAKEAGFTGIGKYNNRIHVDVRSTILRKVVSWDNR